MRYFVVFLSALAILAMARGQAMAQAGFDRRGSDYTNFSIRSGDPSICASRCERDQRCKAWSFSYPRTAHTAATCWLKNQVPPRVADKCCVSGVRGAGVVEPRLGAVEYSIDRTGGDYRNFETPADAAGSACKTACESDKHCRAWTYRRPGYGTAGARCYLKNRIKRPRRAPCCISGVVR
ncbi:MAG TPA: PAN domain-containing protein [Pseudolabrys sp.]|nr:PAN domain-containing protein [Pseudolabrys sp.]